MLTLKRTGQARIYRLRLIGGALRPSLRNLSSALSHGHNSEFDFYHADCRVGLGVNSPAICSKDLFFTMPLALQEKWVRKNAGCHARGKLPNTVPALTDEILYMTIMGKSNSSGKRDYPPGS